MVSRGYQNRACCVVLVKTVKNPIKLAREMLVRGGGETVDSSEPYTLRRVNEEFRVAAGLEQPLLLMIFGHGEPKIYRVTIGSL